MIEVLVGMIGSGKSTYARQRADQDALVINHDDLTRMLHGGVPRYEFALRDLYQAIFGYIAVTAIHEGRDVVVDRTHLTRASRKFWLELGQYMGVEVVAVQFPIESPEVHAQRRFAADARDRTLETWLQVAQHHGQQATLEPLEAAEGFARIITIANQGETHARAQSNDR